MSINQNKEDFRNWLRSQPGSKEAIAGDPCHCWLAEWFESQGVYVWGVFPQHYLERCSDAPGGASQEILLDEPEKDEKTGEWIADRIPLEEWACNFATKLDRLYFKPLETSFVTRNEALAVLAVSG